MRLHILRAQLPALGNNRLVALRVIKENTLSSGSDFQGLDSRR
jgi:hypothetical protein